MQKICRSLTNEFSGAEEGLLGQLVALSGGYGNLTGGQYTGTKDGFPAGSDLFFSFSAANRDPRKFAEPDRFDIDRDASALLTFGGGAHFCLGAGLARIEARFVFEELFAAARGFGLEEPVRWRTNNPVVRAPERLIVTCERC